MGDRGDWEGVIVDFLVREGGGIGGQWKGSLGEGWYCNGS